MKLILLSEEAWSTSHSAFYQDANIVIISQTMAGAVKNTHHSLSPRRLLGWHVYFACLPLSDVSSARFAGVGMRAMSD